MRLDITWNVEVVAAHADDQAILDHHWRGGRVIEVVHVADRFSPALVSILEIQRNQIAVRRFEVQPALVHGGAAISEMVAAGGLPAIVPDLPPRSRVDRPDVVGNGEVQDAVDLQRRALDRPKRRTGGRDAEHPGQTQLVNV